jgi:hypothetical protein
VCVRGALHATTHPDVRLGIPSSHHVERGPSNEPLLMTWKSRCRPTAFVMQLTLLPNRLTVQQKRETLADSVRHCGRHLTSRWNGEATLTERFEWTGRGRDRFHVFAPRNRRYGELSRGPGRSQLREAGGR